MSFIKQGEAIEISAIENTVSCVPMVPAEVLENFKKFAANLKKIAPKAEDFLYFSAIMMHAAEAAALNDDGTPRLTSKGEKVEVGWDKSGNTWRWTSNDPNIKPYKNSNGDIFPEEELVKAYKKWVGKPLCVDHKSSSVEHVRGFIVDTYYDRNLKRVVALCALDKAGYPQLARQVTTGVSNCVSMGTAVGKAICTDCARVARTESDFCDHMRRKSCYGEINVDLNPIELSIVVNGADPRANIKHIIAAAQTMNNYLENKQKELEKIAEKFTANLSFNQMDPNGSAGGAVTNVNVESPDLDTFRKDVDKAIADFQKLQDSLSNEEKDAGSGNVPASNQLEGAAADTPVADSGLPPPHARYASSEVGVNVIAELREAMKAIESKLNTLKTGLETLANTSTIQTQEENMSGTNINKQGYFQGAGGVNEPTPGQAKYPKDPLNEQLRDHEDKQMVGQNGFPGVGPVDGMHASPDSADQKNELERKKMLARAQSEERAIRRQAIVNLAKQALEEKKGYFLGGGGVNEPTPGKTKYPVDKLEYTLREKEDKHMVGQKPFPNVGPVDGMHPSPQSAETSDELKRKEMLRRASLRARFVKASNQDGSQNLGKSAWEVFQGDKLLLTASVDELSNGMSDSLYEKIATKEFGVKLIERVKTDGATKVASLFKRAQVPPAAPAGDAGGVPPAGPVGGGESAPPAGDAAGGGAGDTGMPGDNLLEKLEKIRDMASDAVEEERKSKGEEPEMGGDMGAPAGGASGGGESAPLSSAQARAVLNDLIAKVADLANDAVEGVKALSSEQAELSVTASAESFGDSTLNNLRKELNGALSHALKEAIAELNDHREELQMISGLYDKGAVNPSNAEYVGVIVQDAVNEAKSAVADGFKLMTAFVKYARGTKAIVKRAEIEAELAALAADGDATMTNETDTHSDDDLMNLISSTDADLDAVNELLADDGDLGAVATDANEATLQLEPGEQVPANLPPNTKLETGKTASFETKQGRAALRAKLAADATGKEEDGEVQDMSHAKFSDMLDQADKLADGQTELEVKPSDSLGLVETLPEVNKAMMELAKAPPKVRKEAEAIQRLVAQGKLDPADLDALVAEGLDKDAVAYWKKYYGQTDGGSEFASELVKEHVKAQLEEELSKYRVKLARAYELAYDMVDRGLCHNDRGSVSSQVDEIMKFNDEGFESLKRVVARHAPVLRKEAGRMPQVGLFGSSDAAPTTQAVEGNLYDELSAALSKGTKRMF